MTILFDGKVKTATSITATNTSINYPVTNIQHPFLLRRFQGSMTGSVITITLAEPVTIDCFFYAVHNLNALTAVLKNAGGSTLDTIVASTINDVGVEYFTAVDAVKTIELTIACASGAVYLGGFEAGQASYIGRFVASWTLDFNDRSLYWKSRGGQVTSDIAAMLRAYKFQFRELLKADIDAMIISYMISGASPVFIDVTEDDRTFIAPLYGQILRVPAGQKTDRRFSTELIIEESR